MSRVRRGSPTIGIGGLITREKQICDDTRFRNNVICADFLSEFLPVRSAAECASTWVIGLSATTGSAASRYVFPIALQSWIKNTKHFTLPAQFASTSTTTLEKTCEKCGSAHPTPIKRASWSFILHGSAAPILAARPKVWSSRQPPRMSAWPSCCSFGRGGK